MHYRIFMTNSNYLLKFSAIAISKFRIWFLFTHKFTSFREFINESFPHPTAGAWKPSSICTFVASPCIWGLTPAVYDELLHNHLHNRSVCACALLDNQLFQLHNHIHHISQFLLDRWRAGAGLTRMSQPTLEKTTWCSLHSIKIDNPDVPSWSSRRQLRCPPACGQAAPSLTVR